MREFALRLPLPATELVDRLVPEGFLAGVPAARFAGRFDEPLDDVLLVAVTEKRTRAEIDAFVDAVGGQLRRRRPCLSRVRPSTRSRGPAATPTRLPALDVPDTPLDELVPPRLQRSQTARLPEVSEIDLVRHFTGLSALNFGVDTGFYPLGLVHHEVQPQDQRGRRPSGRLRRSASLSSRTGSCRAPSSCSTSWTGGWPRSPA